MLKETFDIAVIGGGPAGLSAALTGRIRNKSIGLFESVDFSKKLQQAHLIDNYLGMPQITGQGLMQQFSAHCLAHKPALIKEKVLNIYPGKTFTLVTANGTHQAQAVIMATGVISTLLFEGEKDFLGRGVSYCATCDGMFFKGRDVAVISYTQAGEHEAEYLNELCHNVYYLPQYRDVGKLSPDIKLISDRPQSVSGQGQVEKLITNNGELKVHGVFILRQSDPVDNILPGIELENEVIKVNRHMETNIPGVFAAGDCTGRPWQIAKATGEGLVAVLSAVEYLENKTRKV